MILDTRITLQIGIERNYYLAGNIVSLENKVIDGALLILARLDLVALLTSCLLLLLSKIYWLQAKSF
jgi:hypothetical protein